MGQSDRPSDDASKLPRMESEHNEAKLVFDAINEQLMTELPQLVDMRIPYLDPSLEMMTVSRSLLRKAMNSLVAYNGTSQNKCVPIMPKDNWMPRWKAYSKRCAVCLFAA